MPKKPTIRVLVPLERLAEVLRVIAIAVPRDEQTTIKVQDPTRHPAKHDLPVRGLTGPAPAPRWRIITGLLLGAVVGLAAVLAIPVLGAVVAVLVIGVTALLGGLIGALVARPRAPAAPLLEFEDPERVRVVAIRGLDRHQEAVRRLEAAGLAVLHQEREDALLADLPHGAEVPEPTMPASEQAGPERRAAG